MHKDFTLSEFGDGEAPDTRKEIAKRFYDKNGNGVYAVSKAPRAGATTAFLAAAIDRKERILILEPNGNISSETVAKEAIKYSNDPNAEIVVIPSNHECLKNVQLCEKHPDVSHLPVLPIPEKCDDCELYESCPVTEIVRKKDTLRGAVMTYYKLAAIMLAPQGKKDAETIPLPRQICDILKGFQITVLDEAHILQSGTKVRLDTAWPDENRSFRSNRYDTIEQAYGVAFMISSKFKQILESDMYLQAADKLTAQLRDNPRKHHIRELIVNPAHVEAKYKLTMEFFNSLIDLMINREAYGLTVRDVLNLNDAFHIVTSKRISIGARLEKTDINPAIVVSITGIDTDFVNMVKEYFGDMDTRKHRVIITSATLGSMDFSQFFNKYTKIKKVMYGKEGDPIRSNDKVLFIADNRKQPGFVYSRRSFLEIESLVCPIIAEAVDTLGNDGVMVTVLSKNLAKQIEDIMLYRYGRRVEINYYRSDKSMGVKQCARLHIVINSAYIPVNAFDPICDTLEEARIRLEEVIQADTYQAMTRVKDPAGLEPSAIMAIYCTEEDIHRITRWGHDRVLVPNRDGTGSTNFHYEVYCGEYVRAPRITRGVSLQDMYNKAINHLMVGKKSKIPEKIPQATNDEKTDFGVEEPITVEDDVWKSEEDVGKSEEDIGVGINSSDREAQKSIGYTIILGNKTPLYQENFTQEPQDITNLVSDSNSVNEGINNSLNILNDHDEECYDVDDQGSADDDSPTPSIQSEISEMLISARGLPIVAGYHKSDVTYTVDSLQEYKQHYETQVRENCILEKPREYKTSVSFLKDLFIPRLDIRYTQQDDGTYKASKHDPVKMVDTIDNWLTSHVQGVTTIGMSTLDNSASGIWGCIDIDAHRHKNDSTCDYIRKKFHAASSVELLLEYTDALGITPVVERSGSPYSFHVWLFFTRTSGANIKYFMAALALCAGIDYKNMKIEINPKQSNHSAMKRAGNQVKLPYAFHRVYRTWSKVLNPNAPPGCKKWQSPDIYTPMTVTRINISGIEIMDEKKLITVKEEQRKAKALQESIVVDEDGTVWYNADVTDVNTGGRMQKFYEWAMKQDLCGSDGHMLRLYAARFYLNKGLTVEEVARLFSTQADYDEAYSLKQVKHLASVKCGYIKYDTLRETCPAFVERFEEETGMQIARNAGGGTASSPASCF